MRFDTPVTGAPPRPVALWVSLPFATFAIEVGARGVVTAAPPIVRWAEGQHFGAVYRWARRKGRARCAWLYEDGHTSEEWEA